MAETACGVSYSSSRISNNRGISVTRNCVKCEKVEKQLQKLLDELRTPNHPDAGKGIENGRRHNNIEPT